MSEVRFQLYAEGRKLDVDFLRWLDETRVRDTDRDPSVLVLKFSLAQETDGGYPLLDDSPLVPGAALYLELGLGEAPVRRIFEGQITHVRPHFESIESNCSVEIVAQDGAARMDLEERIRSFSDQTDSEIAAEIFRHNGCTPQVAATRVRWAEDRQLVVQRGSDWAFLRQLAARNGYCCYVAPDGAGGQTGVFGPPDLEGSPQRDLCALGEGANLRWLDLQWAGDRPAEVVGMAIDPLGRRLIRASGGARNTAMGDRAATRLAQDGFANATLKRLLREQVPWEALDGAAQAEAQALPLQVQGELDPLAYGELLVARRPALLKGVGRRYAGLYYVSTVETSLQAGQLVQRFAAGRDALGLSGREAYGQEDA